jgi:hypothetical protein
MWPMMRKATVGRLANLLIADPSGIFLTRSAFERSRWGGGRCASDTADIMGCRNALNRLSLGLANSLFFSVLQAKVDSIPIA